MEIGQTRTTVPAPEVLLFSLVWRLCKENFHRSCCTRVLVLLFAADSCRDTVVLRGDSSAVISRTRFLGTEDCTWVVRAEPGYGIKLDVSVSVVQ